jgi:hypothetical protein
MNEDTTTKKWKSDEADTNNPTKRPHPETTEGHVHPQRNDFNGTIKSDEGTIVAGNQFNTNGGSVHIGDRRSGIFKNYLRRNCWLKLIFCIKPDDEKCMRDWCLTDPQADKERILSSKDPLLEGSCKWVFQDRAFTQWWNNDESQVLWIHGDPGKGKTMMMMAIIDEISQRIKSSPSLGIVSYFFCQNTFQELSHAVAIVRGLSYLLAKQNRVLIRYLRKRYDDAGSRLFDGFNALYSIWETLLGMLQDPSVSKVYLMVDALDECDPQSTRAFLGLLNRHESGLSRKVKWVVTSRNEPSITEHLDCARLIHDTSLELNSSYVREAVKSFIDFKVDELAAKKKYKIKLQQSIKDYLTEHADGTFLWAALVCKELEKEHAFKAQKVMEKFPTGLEPLYQRMMEQMTYDKDVEDVAHFKSLLCTVTLAYRPLHLNEIGVLAGLEEDLYNDMQALQDLVKSCGSFLTVREQTVYLVHQSAKDYFSTGKGSNIFPFGQIKAHDQLAHRSLQLMSANLKRDICSLHAPGVLTKDVGSVRVEQCLSPEVQYACMYWVQHLQKSSTQLHDDDQVHQFLQNYLLYWLEALSLVGKISEGVHAITSLESYLLVSHLYTIYGNHTKIPRPTKVPIYTRSSMMPSDLFYTTDR